MQKQKRMNRIRYTGAGSVVSESNVNGSVYCSEKITKTITLLLCYNTNIQEFQFMSSSRF